MSRAIPQEITLTMLHYIKHCHWANCI